MRRKSEKLGGNFQLDSGTRGKMKQRIPGTFFLKASPLPPKYPLSRSSPLFLFFRSLITDWHFGLLSFIQAAALFSLFFWSRKSFSNPNPLFLWKKKKRKNEEFLISPRMPISIIFFCPKYLKRKLWLWKVN